MVEAGNEFKIVAEVVTPNYDYTHRKSVEPKGMGNGKGNGKGRKAQRMKEQEEQWRDETEMITIKDEPEAPQSKPPAGTEQGDAWTRR